MGSPAKVREVLAERRQAGLDFAAAWPAALEALEPAERQEWRPTLRERPTMAAGVRGLSVTQKRVRFKLSNHP